MSDPGDETGSQCGSDDGHTNCASGDADADEANEKDPGTGNAATRETEGEETEDPMQAATDALFAESAAFVPRGPTVLGFIRLTVFFGVWLGSVIAPLAAILSWFVWDVRWPAYCYLAYISVRIFVRPKPNELVFDILGVEPTPYFRKHELVWEEDRKHRPLLGGKQKFMLAFHPHGFLTCGWACCAAKRILRRLEVTFLATEPMMWTPGILDIMAWSRTESVGRANMVKRMSEDENVALLPGGFEEATLLKRGEHRVYLKNRRGFIKFALQFGYTVYPLYTFGEEFTYWTLEARNDVRLWLNKFGIPAVLARGWWYTFLPDRNISLTTVVGKPIPMPKIEQPTKEDVAHYHQLYIDALKDVFNRRKAQYSTDPDAELQVL